VGIIRCEEIIKDAAGEVSELRCTLIDSDSSPRAPGARSRATIHWLSAEHALPIEARLYDRLFTTEDPRGGRRLHRTTSTRRRSRSCSGAFVEPSMAGAAPGTRVQFERTRVLLRRPRLDAGAAGRQPDDLPARLVGQAGAEAGVSARHGSAIKSSAATL
jgi:hypothetical protein